MTKRTNNDLENTTQKTKDLATRTTNSTQKLGVNSGASDRKAVHVPLVATMHCVTV